MKLARLALVIALLAPLVSAAPVLNAPCTFAPLPAELADTSCTPIHPGARMSNGCTMNFVVTDGIDLFIGTAGHCASLGMRVGVPGHPDIGGVVLDGARGDWAFIRIDAEDRGLVDPTLAQWGGPQSIRPPVTGELVVHYGWGASLGQIDATRGRVGEVILSLPDSTATSFWYLGSVDGGDSGSPVMTLTGEAAGIAVATFLPGAAPSVTIATRFDLAVDELSDSLGRPVTLVEGRAFVA